jgi:hypothetical protein
LTAQLGDVQMDIAALAADIWKELEEGSLVEQPLNVKPFYNDIIKVEDPTNSNYKYYSKFYVNL